MWKANVLPTNFHPFVAFTRCLSTFVVLCAWLCVCVFVCVLHRYPLTVAVAAVATSSSTPAKTEDKKYIKNGEFIRRAYEHFPQMCVLVAPNPSSPSLPIASDERICSGLLLCRLRTKWIECGLYDGDLDDAEHSARLLAGDLKSIVYPKIRKKFQH